MSGFSVSVLEGTSSDDIATYFCEEEPEIVSKHIEGEPEFVVFVKFIPRNGSPMRVGRTTFVPMARVTAISNPT
jgi:hypothetical protein